MRLLALHTLHKIYVHTCYIKINKGYKILFIIVVECGKDVFTNHERQVMGLSLINVHSHIGYWSAKVKLQFTTIVLPNELEKSLLLA